MTNPIISFIVAWASYINNHDVNDPNKYDIYAKKIRFQNIDTDIQNADFLINDYTGGNQIAPVMAIDYTYNEVVFGWIDQNGRDRLPTIVGGLDYGSYGRRVSKTSNSLSLISGVADFQINSSAITGHQTLIDIKISPVTGELYTVGQHQNFPGGNGYDVIFRKFTRGSGGVYTAGTEQMVNTTTSSDQSSPSLVVNSITGNYAISWSASGSGITGWDCFSKIYDQNNAVVKTDFKVAPFLTNNNELAPKVAWDESSNYLTYFHWYSVGGSTSIRYTVFDDSYNKVKDDVHAINKNLYNYYGANYDVAYDQAMRRVYLVYDQYTYLNSPVTTGWFRQLKYSGLPNIESTSTHNYIEVQKPFKEIKDEALLENLPVSVAYIGRTYFDGLGRPIQAVSVQSSPLGLDDVQAIEYDQFGRQVKSYLPYVHSSQNGAYKPDYATAQANFYSNNSNNNEDKIVNDLYPYAEKVIESTVPNRIFEQSSPGNSWKLGSGHTMISSMELNTINEVRRWTVNSTTSTSSSYYPEGALYKNIHSDEAGKTTQTFKDKFDKTICVKEIAAGCPTCVRVTYYVYDIFGNLRYVIPPQVVEELTLTGQSSWTITYNGTANVDQMVFAYKYDKRQRLVEKKAPDQAVKYLIYNKLNKPVLTQDGNQRPTGKWSFAKYDAMGRTIMTGIYTDTRTVAQIEADIYSKPQYEKRSASSTTAYTNTAYPIVNDSDILTLEYYDDHNYDFDNNSSTSHPYIAAGFSPEPIPVSRNKGRHICSKKRNLSNNDWLITINFYDKYGRKIQERNNNHKNLSIVSSVSFQYEYGGLLLNKKEVVNTSIDQITALNRFEYDNSRKLKNVFHKINNQTEILLSNVKLNELGQMVEKNLHSENAGNTFLQSIDYTYNIRGWVTHINNSTLTNSALNASPEDNNDDDDDLFGVEMVFDKLVPGVNRMYNGSIAAVFWKTNNPATSTQEKAYSYVYDGFDQMEAAWYGVKQSGNFQWGFGNSETHISYDKNGNLKTLRRYAANGTPIDNLSYQYTGTGNRANAVIDGSGSSLGFTDRMNQANEMAYDANGNLIADGNKGITSIVYNHLNLPVTVVMGASGNNNRLEFVYDAAGRMLSRKVIKAGVVTATFDYTANLYYENNTCKFMLTSEGRAVKSTTGTFSYQYMIKDHLGNNRVIFDKDISGVARIVQEDHYYAFGMSMLSYGLANDGGAHCFLFNRKEYLGGMDINGDLVNDYDWDVYDFGARMYDAKLGRWFNPDPADQFTNFSPYGYCMNNPPAYVDPDGRFIPILIGVLVGAYIGGTIANGGEFNPGKWDWDSPKTYLGLGIGGIVGAIGGAVAAGGNVAAGIVTPAGTAVVSYSSTTGSVDGLAFAGEGGGYAGIDLSNDDYDNRPSGYYHKTNYNFPIHSSPGQPGAHSELEEKSLLSRHSLVGKVTMVSPSTFQYNCFGYVFLDGSRLLNNGMDVEMILAHNYSWEIKPKPGDVAIYRSWNTKTEDYEIIHAGVVVQSNIFSTTIRSKWGRYGLYDHAPNDVPYYFNNKVEYYRSHTGTNTLLSYP